jgi:hypothetical protein
LLLFFLFLILLLFHWMMTLLVHFYGDFGLESESCCWWCWRWIGVDGNSSLKTNCGFFVCFRGTKTLITWTHSLLIES